MAHESFEDTEIARILNEHFVSIKVDREERPDVDKIYMSVCQALTGQGGWPLSVFLTPQGNPFFAGTYFPKTTRMGLIAFPELLTQINHMWKTDRERLLTAGNQITEHIRKSVSDTIPGKALGVETLDQAAQQLSRQFDARWGGFGKAPKFPSPHQLTFLLRCYVRGQDENDLQMVEKTLSAMRQGGIFDHVGYGFHRYSVDVKWFAPHFEKMLYDQALLAMAYTEAFQVTGTPAYSRVAREVFTYVLRDMTAPEGGFYSAEDADSEGKEGLFYLWTPQEVEQVLGKEQADLFCGFYNITAEGNFEEGRNIPHTGLSVSEFARRRKVDEQELEAILRSSRKQLFMEREKRIHPLKDDKILTSWNGLMIAALFKGYKAVGAKIYLDTAREALDFILNALQTKEGLLLRRYREGETAHAGYLDDYAFLVWALVEGYEADFDPGYLEKAVALTHTMLDLFWDREDGGLFFTGRENDPLIVRSKDAQDGAIPSGNSVAALNLLRLGRLIGDTTLEEKANGLMGAFSGQVDAYPTAHTQLLQALDFIIGPAREIVIAGRRDDEDTQSMVDHVHRNFLPRDVMLLISGEDVLSRLATLAPFVREMTGTDGKATAYVCRQYACQAPITDPEELKNALHINV